MKHFLLIWSYTISLPIQHFSLSHSPFITTMHILTCNVFSGYPLLFFACFLQQKQRHDLLQQYSCCFLRAPTFSNTATQFPIPASTFSTKYSNTTTTAGAQVKAGKALSRSENYFLWLSYRNKRKPVAFPRFWKLLVKLASFIPENVQEDK